LLARGTRLAAGRNAQDAHVEHLDLRRTVRGIQPQATRRRTASGKATGWHPTFANVAMFGNLAGWQDGLGGLAIICHSGKTEIKVVMRRV
jgi:hypothetical protein